MPTKEEQKEFVRIRNGYSEHKTTIYVELRVNLYYNEEIVMENVPIRLAKYKKKLLIGNRTHLEKFFRMPFL